MKTGFRFGSFVIALLSVLSFLFPSDGHTEVSSVCRSDLLRFSVWPYRPTCSQLRELSRFELKSECQLYRISDLDESDRRSLQQALKKYSIPLDDRDRLNSVMGQLRSVAGKKLASCRVIDPAIKTEVDSRQEMLILAIQKGNLEKVKELVAIKASANLPHKKKGSEFWPLLEAARSGQYEILRFLRDEGGAKPFKKIAGSETIIDRMNEEIAVCEAAVSKCPSRRKEYLEKSIRILVHYE